jgi:hypothetical protein
MLHVASTPSLEFHPEIVYGAKSFHGSQLIFYFCPAIIWCILEPNIYHNIIYPK